jgi:hypothetical protein
MYVGINLATTVLGILVVEGGFSAIIPNIDHPSYSGETYHVYVSIPCERC